MAEENDRVGFPMMTVIAASAAVVGSVLLLAFGLLPTAGDQTVSKRRGIRLAKDDISQYRKTQLNGSALERFIVPGGERFLSTIGKLTPVGFVDASARRLVAAGMTSTVRLEVFMAIKICLGLFSIVSAMFFTSFDAWYLNVAVILGSGAAGFWMPDYRVSKKAERRQDEMRAALPETLDQLTVIVEAGLGFDSALKRVVQSSEGPLVDEFARVLRSIRLGQSRSDALGAVAERVDVLEVRQFVSAIRQADKLGVPIGKILRTQSEHMRELTRLESEEKAMKLPVKLTFPMVFCMLPALFVVLLGPIVVRVMSSGL